MQTKTKIIHTMEIDNNGNIFCLYTDKINLFSVGWVVDVRKASNVEFNQDEQVWEVLSLDGKVLHKNTNRQAAIDWEIVNFSVGGLYYHS